MISSDRRMFLQTAGATLALPLIAGFPAAAQSRQLRDPVLAEILRQTKAAAQKALKPGAAITGEPARQLASALRMLTVHGTTIGVDAAVERALNKAVDREGRQAILARRPDASALAPTVGLDVDINRLSTAADDPIGRAAALDALLKRGGVARGWLAFAHALEQVGDDLDRKRGVQPIRQMTPDCTGAQFLLFLLEVQMLAACGPWAIAVPEVCAIATVSYLTWRFYMWTVGC